MEHYISKCSNEKLGAYFTNKAVQDFAERMDKVLTRTSSNSRAAKLWMKYHHLISIVKDFILAERLHDFDLHLSTATKMLPIFAAAGHGQYAKGLRLYLELMAIYEMQYNDVTKAFRVKGLHTVRYSEHEWSGV